jgi:hypothetical protein
VNKGDYYLWSKLWQESKAAFDRSISGRHKLLNSPFRRTNLGQTVDEIYNLCGRHTGHFEHMTESDYAKLVTLVPKLERESTQYLQALEMEIHKEKWGDGGKENSVVYRDLKIHKAEVQEIVSIIKTESVKARAHKQAEGHTKVHVLVTLAALVDGIRSRAHSALLWGQQRLQDQDCAKFNSGIQGAARDLTQQLANLKKYALAEDQNAAQLASRGNTPQDTPELRNYAQVLSEQVRNAGVTEDVLVLLRKPGTETALGATLADLATGQCKLPDGSPPKDVVAATKHFMNMVKRCLEIADRMQGIASGKAVKPEPGDVPPTYKAPEPPPRAAAAPAPRLPRDTPPNKPLPPRPLPPIPRVPIPGGKWQWPNK